MESSEQKARQILLDTADYLDTNKDVWSGSHGWLSHQLNGVCKMCAHSAISYVGDSVVRACVDSTDRTLNHSVPWMILTNYQRSHGPGSRTPAQIAHHMAINVGLDTIFNDANTKETVIAKLRQAASAA